MKRVSISFVLMIFLVTLPVSGDLAAQEPSAPYLLPQTIFVGDSGRLVVPLSQALLGVDPQSLEPFVLETFGILDVSPELAIRRIELERRGGSSRLLIDFIPYAPGVLSFPPLDLYSLNPDQVPVPGPEPEADEVKIPSVTGLKVQVASILNSSQMALSDPAPPLAAPGTSFLIYGFIVFILVMLFFGIGISLWGRRHFAELWERFRRRRLLRLMVKFLRRLRQESNLENDGKAGFYLTILSGEFREFLSLFTKVSCNSFSAEEFLELSLGYDDNTVSPVLSPFFLCRLFRSWDIMRFSGKTMGMPDLLLALAETERFIWALNKAEREKPLPKTFIKAQTAMPLGWEGI